MRISDLQAEELGTLRAKFAGRPAVERSALAFKACRPT